MDRLLVLVRMKFSERTPEDKRGFYRILSGFLGGVLLGLLLGLFLYPRLYPTDLSLPPGLTVEDRLGDSGNRVQDDDSLTTTPDPTASGVDDLPDSDTLSPPVTMGEDWQVEGERPARTSGHLVIPVEGVRPLSLYDSYDDGRSGGRVHNAIDIPAPEGTPVLAAVDGEILRLFESDRGGLTIYQRGVDGRIYYYAHLSRYAGGISAGTRVRAGGVIAYVGNTGNAGPENYHLHFAIWIPESSDSYWDGVAINPYPLLVP